MGRERKLPIFKRGDYWYCYVRTPDGRRHQRALHIRDDGSEASYRAAVAAYWQEQSRATAGNDVGQRKATLAQGLKALHAEQELAGVREHSLDTTRYRGRCLVRHFTGECDLTQLKAADLVAYATEARKTRSAPTVRMELSVLARAMRALDIAVPRKPKIPGGHKPQEPLTPAEVKRFFAALGRRHRLLGLTLLSLGPRTSEPGKIDQVDWTKRLLHIAGTKTAGSDRWVPIPPELWEHMEALNDRGEWTGFPAYKPGTVGMIVRRACKRAGIGPRSPNDLRGTWSTNAALAGVSPEVRGVIQGNSAAMQVRVYSRPGTRPEELHDDMARGTMRITPPKPCITGAATTARAAANAETFSLSSGSESLKKTTKSAD